MINKINIDCLDIPNWNHSDELLIECYTPMSSSISWTYAYDAVGDSLLNDDCICRVRGYDFITYVDAASSSKLPDIAIETDEKMDNTTIEIKTKFNFEEAMDILRALKACTHSDTINKESFAHKYATALMYALDSCLSDVRFCQLHGIPIREKNHRYNRDE